MHSRFSDCLLPVIDNRRILEPLATDMQPRLSRLDGIRVVVLDVYGTLVISGSGEVGTAEDKRETEDDSNPVTDPISIAASAAGVTNLGQLPTMQRVRARIERVNQSRLFETNPRPEIEILDIWRAEWVEAGRPDIASDPPLVCEIAARVESIANPTWPMPGAADALQTLHARGLLLGIVSNAQVFTIPLVEDLIGGPLESCFELNLCHFSNRYRASKPGPLMFDRLVRELARRNIAPEQAVYVGNDMLNDVFAAKNAGLKTALFAGDARSLRLRQDHASCADLSSDVVMTSWNHLVECLG
ncbi:putative hydrolase of the HAD superfamily [Rhodopirellula rubra]|uniref:Putative hydrolase of the HAD superfamily n=1 Tax=Aporhodopirellula rubra TaxID=980271 RepID=A0A7W5DZE0_9BACT|nr:HAD family hydrolase [Aporhodopirellula rubra]MBB3206893.1 putative hydrolase of the HAD superfamily [Aporhodopirellula rubra]